MNISNQGERRLSYKYRNQKVVEEKSRRVECQNQILLFPFCIFKIQLNIKRQQIP